GCATVAQPFAVLREGPGEVVVLAAPAGRAGGLLGTREASVRAGLGPAATWIDPAALAEDATSTLVATGLRAPAASLLSGASILPASDARVIALSAAEGGALVADAPPGVAYACAPKLGGAEVRQTVCVQSGPQ